MTRWRGRGRADNARVRSRTHFTVTHMAMLYCCKYYRVSIVLPQPHTSMLAHSAAKRLAMALTLLMLLWAAVAWAVAVP